MLRYLKPESKPLSPIGLDKMPLSYRELSEIGFWQVSVLSQFQVIEIDLEESTNSEE